MASVPRPSNTEERRAQIVDGLLIVMADRGYAGASVNAIAKAAKLTPGLLHYHFQNKREMLTTLVAKLAAQLRGRYETKLAHVGDDPWKRLDAFVDAHLKLGPGADPRAVSSWIVIASEATREADVRHLYRASVAERLDDLHDLIRGAMRHEGRRTHAAKRLAASAMSAIEGAFLLSAATDDLLPSGYAAPTLQRWLNAAILAEPRA